MRVALFIAFSFASVPAWAQLSLSRFDASPAADRFFGVGSADVGEHLTFAARLTPDWAHNPLVLHDNHRTIVAVVQNQVFANLGLSLGLFERLQLSVDLPLALAQSGPSPNGLQSPSGFSIGEIRFGLRGRLVTAFSGLLTVSVGVFVWAPINAMDASFAGDGFVRGKAEVLLSGQRERYFWTLSLGADIRRPQLYLEVTQGSMARINAGAGVLLLSRRQLQIGPELSASVLLKNPTRNNINAEALLGVRYRFLNRVEVGLGGGAGLMTGIGTPDVRVVASLGYAFTFGRDTPILVEHAPASAPAMVAATPVPAPVTQLPAPSAPEPAPIVRALPLKSRQLALREQIQFKSNSDVILQASEAILQALLEQIYALPAEQHLLIEGHTDNRGSPHKNRTLSERRAHAVVAWLVAHGVAAERFASAGFGPDRPLATNDTQRGRLLNRRVEIHLVN